VELAAYAAAVGVETCAAFWLDSVQCRTSPHTSHLTPHTPSSPCAPSLLGARRKQRSQCERRERMPAKVTCCSLSHVTFHSSHLCRPPASPRRLLLHHVHRLRTLKSMARAACWVTGELSECLNSHDTSHTSSITRHTSHITPRSSQRGCVCRVQLGRRHCVWRARLSGCSAYIRCHVQ
jgi:hypothetical protein